MGYIYKIINIKNQKIYIGQTTKKRPTDRFSQHKYLALHPQQEKNISYLHRAMKSDGIDNFKLLLKRLNEIKEVILLEYHSKI